MAAAVVDADDTSTIMDRYNNNNPMAVVADMVELCHAYFFYVST